MRAYTQQELAQTLCVVSSVIGNCEKVQPKFAEGSPQHTLLKNRLQALYTVRSLLTGDGAAAERSAEDLKKALPPVASILRKCKRGKEKFAEGTPHRTRFQNLIKAMEIAQSLVMDEIRKKG